MINKVSISTALLLVTTSISGASSWMVKVDDDIFSGGQTARLVGYVSAGEFIYASCSSDKVEASFVMRERWNDILRDIPVELAYKSDDGKLWSWPGSFYRHNEEYTGVRLTEKAYAIVTLGAFARAQKSLVVGVDVASGDLRVSKNVPIDGLRKAALQFFRACGIDGALIGSTPP